MLKIKPIREKSEQERLCTLCDVEYKETYLAYGAYEDETPLGISQFIISGNAGYISEIAPVKDTFDAEAMCILGRGVENFMDIVGAHDAYYNGEDTPFIRSLGFSESEGKLYMNLSAFFADPCKNKK